MINFIPGYREDYDEIVDRNPLYKEIFERRSYFDCDTCDYSGDPENEDKCNTCLHRMKHDNIELRKFADRKIEIKEHIPVKKGMFGCSCSKGWTGLVSMYFQRDNKFLVGDTYANYCPLCGEKNIKKEKK